MGRNKRSRRYDLEGMHDGLDLTLLSAVRETNLNLIGMYERLNNWSTRQCISHERYGIA